jgi:hypothetical protein
MGVEHTKLLHDSFKHLTTLSSATILVVATVAIQNLVSRPPLIVAGLALLFFCLCNLMSVLGMFLIAYGKGEKHLLPVSAVAAIGSFVTGLFLLIWVIGYRASGAL